MPIRQIAKRTGLSRNTVRKYRTSNVVEPVYPKRKSPSKLDDYEQTLTSWLLRETRRQRKQRRSIKQLYHDLVALGYTGSYDRVAAFARGWQDTFGPLCFAPGEAFQFDWSEDWAVINGVSTKLQVAHFRLCYSRALCCVPTGCNRTRCCLMPIITDSVPWAGSRSAGFMTT